MASQGQLKTFVLALRLAQFDLIQKNIKPILLLDDIFDRLDPLRIQKLVELFPNFGQIFITDAHLTRIETYFKGYPFNHLKL